MRRDASRVVGVGIEGGGAAGQVHLYTLGAAIAYGLRLDLLEVLAGSSAGVHLAAGLTYRPELDWIKAYLAARPLGKVLKVSWLWQRPITSVLRWIGADGLLPSKPVLDFAGGLAEEAGIRRDITFRQLYEDTGRMLLVTTAALVTRARDHRVEPRSWSPIHSPDAHVVPAVAASSMIPFAFPPFLLDRHPSLPGPFLNIDGGLGRNLPGGSFRVLLPKAPGETEEEYKQKFLLLKVDTEEEAAAEKAQGTPWLNPTKGELAAATVRSLRRDLNKAWISFPDRVVTAVAPIGTLETKAVDPALLTRWGEEAMQSWITGSGSAAA